MGIAKPFNLQTWIEENRHLLKPPVGNKQIYIDNEDFIVMIVGGPNGRKDYHWEEGEELFYQLEGDIQVKIINDDGKPETIDIREGEQVDESAFKVLVRQAVALNGSTRAKPSKKAKS